MTWAKIQIHQIWPLCFLKTNKGERVLKRLKGFHLHQFPAADWKWVFLESFLGKCSFPKLLHCCYRKRPIVCQRQSILTDTAKSWKTYSNHPAHQNEVLKVKNVKITSLTCPIRRTRMLSWLFWQNLVLFCLNWKYLALSIGAPILNPGSNNRPLTTNHWNTIPLTGSARKSKGQTGV